MALKYHVGQKVLFRRPNNNMWRKGTICDYSSERRLYTIEFIHGGYAGLEQLRELYSVPVYRIRPSEVIAPLWKDDLDNWL